jgi:hypothetical protein
LRAVTHGTDYGTLPDALTSLRSETGSLARLRCLRRNACPGVRARASSCRPTTSTAGRRRTRGRSSMRSPSCGRRRGNARAPGTAAVSAKAALAACARAASRAPQSRRRGDSGLFVVTADDARRHTTLACAWLVSSWQHGAQLAYPQVSADSTGTRGIGLGRNRYAIDGRGRANERCGLPAIELGRVSRHAA